MNMPSKLMVSAFVLVAAVACAGCAEIQRAAEDAARKSGNPRLAGAIRGTGSLVGGLSADRV